MSGNFIENTVKWLRKKVRNKVQKVKVRLRSKYKFLLEEKMKLDDIWRKRREDTKKNNAGKENWIQDARKRWFTTTAVEC